jgi:type IV pilus assembly protein PilM
MLSMTRDVVAVDIGSGCVKMVRLFVHRGRITLGEFGAIDIDPGIVAGADNHAQRNLAAASCVGELFRRFSIRPGAVRNLVSCMSGSQVSIKQIRTHRLSDAELSSSLVFEARKHIPIEGELIIDYQVVNCPEGAAEQDILLVVAAKQAVAAHASLLSSCGLKPGIIDPGPCALVNSHVLSPRTERYPTFAIINIGASSTTIAICRENGLFFTRDIAIGGNKFTEDLQHRLGTGFAEAEIHKRSNGVFGGDGKPERGVESSGLALATHGAAMSAEALTKELQRSVRFYLKEAGGGTIDSFLLTGGGVLDSTLATYIATAFNTHAVVYDPFASFDGNGRGTIPNRAQYAQAVGMALRGIHELFPDQFK